VRSAFPNGPQNEKQLAKTAKKCILRRDPKSMQLTTAGHIAPSLNRLAKTDA
jgi:hypothetical protein